MRLVWLLCLTGSITCAPVEKGLGLNSAETQTLPWYTFRGTGSSELGSDSDKAPQRTSSGYGVQSLPPYTLYEAPAAGSLGYTVGQYGAPGVGSDRYAVGQYQTGPTQFNTQSGIGDDENKLVFSDVSGLEPVYSISSRSRYHKGRAVFAQTRYTPTESLGLSVPLFPYTSYMFAP
ncbi:unnamed protein product [Oreochromis niloticus]|nr:unnamed protein product [Mustela putorius furo]